jgi:hypothetical protein
MNKTLKITCVLSLILVSCSLVFVNGCCSCDRTAYSEFEPIKTEDGYQYFKYKVWPDAFCPPDNNGAEIARIAWLEEWLANNGYPNSPYEIISRQLILKYGNLYDIHYEVRVKK